MDTGHEPRGHMQIMPSPEEINTLIEMDRRKEEQEFLDKCAISALQGVLSSQSPMKGYEYLASTSYRYANSMLEERRIQIKRKEEHDKENKS